MKKMKFPLPHRVRSGQNAEWGFETKQGAHPDIQVNVQRKLGNEQYVAAMKRLRSIINDQKLRAVDSDAVGDKYTTCNWGLCSDAPELWPTPDLHVWPYEFLNNGRVAPLGRLGLCHMDARERSDGQGCFWTCRVFQRRFKTPDKKEARELLEQRIFEAS